MTADVIHLAYSSVMDYEVYSFTMILYVEPIAHVLALSVYGEGLIVERISDHKRNELFGEVIGAVVVRAAADGNGKSEGAVICKHQKVCARL